jgi:signal transduction histidine kinase
MNAFRHADAAAIQVLLHYDSEQLSLQVIDDGKGIDQDIIHTGRAGHWGITGLFERTACIGGTLILEKIEAGGTRVLLTVPSSRAYIDQSRWWTQLPRWLSRDK